MHQARAMPKWSPLLVLPLAIACGQAPVAKPGDGDMSRDVRAPHPDLAGTTPTRDGGDGGGAGWLYTSGNKIYLSDGNGGGTVWVGRGVNMDDLFFCGYNNSLWMSNAETTIESIVAGLMQKWKPTFIRLSFAMNSYTKVSWLANEAQYKTPMTKLVQAITAYPHVYLLITLRTDATMIGPDEATNVPTPSTDAVYRALVDSFGTLPNVIFGVSNEPGGNSDSDATIRAAMDHAVATIRAEEDKLGVHHHLVSVQGNNWTSNISFYDAQPLLHDNVVYEVHGYPPATGSYTFANLPVILGEYGSLDNTTQMAFYADVETKQIPSLAWDFDPYNDCAPDLLQVNQSATNLVPSPWGSIVQAYLLAHAQ
jgi:hypothetical protein